jgi:hypothetical protein
MSVKMKYQRKMSLRSGDGEWSGEFRINQPMGEYQDTQGNLYISWYI